MLDCDEDHRRPFLRAFLLRENLFLSRGFVGAPGNGRGKDTRLRLVYHSRDFFRDAGMVR